MRYSITSIELIFIKPYGFLSFAKDTSNNLSRKYGLKVFGQAKQLLQLLLKPLEKE